MLPHGLFPFHNVVLVFAVKCSFYFYLWFTLCCVYVFLFFNVPVVLLLVLLY